MGTPTSQSCWNRFIHHIASGLCRFNALLDLLDPMRRSSLKAKPGKLSFVHETAKNKTQEQTIAFLRLSANDVRNNILD